MQEKKDLRLKIEQLTREIDAAKNENKNLLDQYAERQKKDKEEYIVGQKAIAAQQMPYISEKEFFAQKGKSDEYIFAMYGTGSIVSFGHYAGKPIEWLVLGEEGDKRVMISVKGLESSALSRNLSSDWERSTLHEWLNECFYSWAFTSEEQARLTEGVTGDMVYLLSRDEAKEYFENDEARICKSLQHGTRTEEPVSWWLRSISDTLYSDTLYRATRRATSFASIVESDGSINSHGLLVDCLSYVRPVVTLRI